jgi:hypothetical protein
VTRAPITQGLPTALLGLAMALGCGAAPKVERRVGGQAQMGRSIPGEAYAWYARGQFHEREGHPEPAEYAYGQAVRADSASGAAWAGLLRTRCARSAEEAWETLDRAEARALEPLPVLLSASACAVRHKMAGHAVAWARSALELEPGSEEASRALEVALATSGNRAAADAVARAFYLYRGYPLRRDPKLAAEHVLYELTEARKLADYALVEGELEEARRISVGTLTDGELALRALLLNRPEIARSLAQKVLFLDAEDGEASLALAGALALSNAEVPGAVWMHVAARPASPLFTCAYAVLLPLWVGPEQARGYASRSSCEPSDKDPLQTHLAEWLAQSEQE